MGKRKIIPTEEKIIEFVRNEILKLDDPFEEIDLTQLEEEIQNELDIPEDVWEEEDYSFFVYSWLVEQGYLND